MNIINISTTLLLFVIGFFIKYKKVTWLISGYNTSSKEEKEKYDLDKLTRLVGNFVMILGGTWGLITIAYMIFPDDLVFVIVAGCCLEFLVIIGGIIYLNTRGRVKK